MRTKLLAGQAVPDGVLMFYDRRWAVAVRGPEKIAIEKGRLPGKGSLSRLPFIRGVWMLGVQVAIGTKAMLFSTQASDDDEDFGWPAMIWALSLSIVLALALFKILPFLLAGALAATEDTYLFQLLDGAFRILIFFGYLLIISRLGDVQRMFAYHGAEHKVINAYEETGKLSLSASAKASRFHDRCSTNFIVLVLLIAVVLFSAVPLSLPAWMVISLRLLMLPVIAAIAYELVRWMSAYPHSLAARIVRWPGILVQRLTTREPSKEQLQVALRAAREVLRGSA